MIWRSQPGVTCCSCVIITFLLFSACSVGKRTSSRNSKINKTVATARSYIGTPYQWGGNTAQGIDCSGLIFKSYQSVGIKLPRTAKDQSKLGRRVKINKLEPGDLLFFAAKKGKKKGKGKITHVGLVTEKKGAKDLQFIHASSSKGVVERNLFTPYYLKIFVRARRPF